MIVEAVNGRYYRNPIVIRDRWLLEANEDGVLIKREGEVVWNTARRGLARGGVKCRCVAMRDNCKAILGERLVKVSVFEVEIRKPIPVPDSHEGCLHFKPSSEELEGESLLVWS